VLLFCWYYECSWLSGKTPLWNDLLCVEWGVKPYSLAHLLKMASLLAKSSHSRDQLKVPNCADTAELEPTLPLGTPGALSAPSWSLYSWSSSERHYDLLQCRRTLPRKLRRTPRAPHCMRLLQNTALGLFRVLELFETRGARARAAVRGARNEKSSSFIFDLEQL